MAFLSGLASYSHRRWSPGAVTMLQVIALAAPLLVVLLDDALTSLQRLSLCLVATLIWEMIFALLRRQMPAWHGVTTAIVVAIMVPVTVPLWQLVLAVSFGVVLGELVFGGRGFGFLSPAVATLAFLIFSFPGHALLGDSQLIALATVPGALLLIATGLISWRIIVALFLAIISIYAFSNQQIEPFPIVASLAFGTVFLVCDPVGASSTQLGRWVYGALVGTLIAVFDASSSSGLPGFAPTALVFAALLGSVFAPLIDHLIVLLNIRKRGARHGGI